MPTTANGLWYPTLSAANNPPADFQTQGESIDTAYGKSVADWTALLALTGNFKGRRVWVDSLTKAVGPAVYNGTAWIAPKQFAQKSANENVSSSTALQDDDHLAGFIIPAASGTFIGDVFLRGTSAANAAGDLVVGFTFPTGTFHAVGFGPDVGLASGFVQTGAWNSDSAGFTSGATGLQFGLSTATIGIHIHFDFVATAAGVLTLQWAQGSSSGNASTLRSGSHMTLEQVA